MTRYLKTTLAMKMRKDALSPAEIKVINEGWAGLRSEMQNDRSLPAGVIVDLKIEEEDVDEDGKIVLSPAEQVLAELDEQFKRFKSAERQATWGGSFEREASGRSEIKALANPMFDALLKLLQLRNPEVPKI